jgi:acetyl/propionyl-CoA carboxylase alpha subunit/acetyl-CoA carboxylase carboxyltransferase component
MKLRYSKIAILNRGEPAVRFLRALREYNLEKKTNMQEVVFYTTPDENAPFVRQARRAIALGAPMREQPDGSLISAYCDHKFIISLLQAEGCDAVWPGWGFISEDASFVAKLEKLNITFIGPSSKAMSSLGDKIAAKYLAEECDVPLAPWKEWKSDWSQSELQKESEKIGFPLMVKASGGGGGRGIRKVHSVDQLQEALQSVQTEVTKVFGQGGILLEKCVTGARHIEVQLIANQQGEAFAVGVRDCSIQRKNQKVIEETPSPILPEKIQQSLCRASERLALRCGYSGAGTAEYLYDPQTNSCTFLEVNSRLQVEHTITEAITGLDLVKAQIEIALGIQWKPYSSKSNGHAIELRVNAENPEKDFQPSPGKVIIFRPPSGPGVRVDSGISEGLEISEHFDSMIAKIIVWAPNRQQCIARALRACKELDAVVEDGATNQAFLADVLQHPAFINGSADTAWLDRAMQEGSVVTVGCEVEALLAAAILEYKLLRKEEINKFFLQNQDGIPLQYPNNNGKSIELRLRGFSYTMQVAALNEEDFLVGPEGSIHQIRFRIISQSIAEMWMENNWHKILYSYGSGGITVELDGYSHIIERSSGGVVKAPAPAVIVGVSVEPGDIVEIGDKLCTLEAMKMEMGVFATEAGTIREVLCRVNQQVLIGDELLLIDPADNDEEESIEQHDFQSANRELLAELYEDGKINPLLLEDYDQDLRKELLEELISLLRASILGFDLLPACEKILQQFFQQSTVLRHSKYPECWLPLLKTLDMFSDSCRLLDRNVLLNIDAASSIPSDVAFYEFCRRHYEEEEAVLESMRVGLSQCLNWYGIQDFKADDWMRETLFRIAVANNNNERRHQTCSSILRIFLILHEAGLETGDEYKLAETFERTAQASNNAYPFVQDNAVQANYLFFERNKYIARLKETNTAIRQLFQSITTKDASHKDVRSAMRRLGRNTQTVQLHIYQIARQNEFNAHRLLEAITRRQYLGQEYHWLSDGQIENCPIVEGQIKKANKSLHILSIMPTRERFSEILSNIDKPIHRLEVIITEEIDLDESSWKANIDKAVQMIEVLPNRVTFSWFGDNSDERHQTYLRKSGRLIEKSLLKDIHPEAASRINLDRLENFDLERIYTHERTYAFIGRALTNPRDERIFVLSEVFGKFEQEADFPLWEFEKVFFEAIRAMREMQSKRTKRSRLRWNWIFFYIHPILNATEEELQHFAERLEPYTRGLNLREVQLRIRLKSNRYKFATMALRRPGNHRLETQWIDTSRQDKIPEMSAYDMRVVRAQKLGHIYPYEIIRLLEGSSNEEQLPHPDMKQGRFQEYDVDKNDRLVPVIRPFGLNECGVVIGMITNCTQKYPEGMTRVWIGSDSTKAMGALAEKECRRILCAIDLAEEYKYPIEWIPISAGAMISMESGTENLDWTARVLQRIIQFTQRGGIINIIVHGINVGAQSYWNAEATMMMHTKGVLIMTLNGSMVLTGKKALDFSGGVSAEDERGIGGAERIMGPNGQAQFIVNDLGEAYNILFECYRYTYRHPKDDKTRLFHTKDPNGRSVVSYPYNDKKHPHFNQIGNIFSSEHNRERKKPFAIRIVMQALIDQDSGYIERFSHLMDGETASVWLSHIGGHSVTLIGIESQPIRRQGRIPIDGPDVWTGGTLFPQSSRKVARSINAASGIHPVVVLANLSGFDGSPESLRKLQLEYGAEIGRAVVNFEGPIIFMVIGRYHGGAYVVFSKALNPNLQAIAVNGSYASVIGGAPAAAVVFPRKVKQLVAKDSRIIEMEQKIKQASPGMKPKLREQLNTLQKNITLEKRGDIANEFDSIHSVQRAISVGSLDAVIHPSEIRGCIIKRLNTSRKAK